MNSAVARDVIALFEARTGQQLSSARSWRIEAALRPLLRENNMSTLEALAARIAVDDRLATRVVEALLNNESSFFRDIGAFVTLDSVPLESLRKARSASRRLAIWSAGCSTGQEAYSLAMLLRDAGDRWEGWTIDLIATDISATAIRRARTGRFSQFEIQRGLPARAMLRWFSQRGDQWTADPSLRRMIRFGVHNVLDPPPGRFDVILCRNLALYFGPEVRQALFDRLAVALRGDGVLMLGAGETVIGQTTRFAAHPAWRGLYTPTGAAAAAAA